MTIKLRFNELQERGIVKSRPQLKRLQERADFPPGVMLSPNVRAWDLEEEILPWLAKRPRENSRPLQGAAKARHERRKAAELTAT
jgi:predicted DNA-binding transcriptional regulator AlpA